MPQLGRQLQLQLQQNVTYNAFAAVAIIDDVAPAYLEELCMQIRGRPRLRSASTGCPARHQSDSEVLRSLFSGPSVWKVCHLLCAAVAAVTSEVNTFGRRMKAYHFITSSRRRRCGVSAILAPYTNVTTYLLTYSVAF